MNRISAPMALFVLLLAAVSAFGAAGVSGTWKGVIDVRAGGSAPEHIQVQLQLQRRGAIVTGEIGREGESERVAISHGRVEGSMVYFEATDRQAEGPVQFRLTQVRDRLQGEITGRANQREFKGQVNLTRETK